MKLKGSLRVEEEVRVMCCKNDTNLNRCRSIGRGRKRAVSPGLWATPHAGRAKAQTLLRVSRNECSPASTLVSAP